MHSYSFASKDTTVKFASTWIIIVVSNVDAKKICLEEETPQNG
jgi:hypothetical protein